MHTEHHRVSDVADCRQPPIRQYQAPVLNAELLLIGVLHQPSVPFLPRRAEHDDHRRRRGRPGQNPRVADAGRRQVAGVPASRASAATISAKRFVRQVPLITCVLS